jgi:WD40 repeat protein
MFFELESNVKFHTRKLSKEIIHITHLNDNENKEFFLLRTNSKRTQAFNLKNNNLQIQTNKAMIIYDNIISYNGDQLVATSDNSNQIRLYSTNNLNCFSEFEKIHVNFPLKFYHFPKIDNNICLTTGDKDIKLWDFMKGRFLGSLGEHENSTFLLNDLSAFKEGFISCTDFNYEIKVWDFYRKEIVVSIKEVQDFINCSLYDNYYDQHHLYICGNESKVRIFNLNSGNCDFDLVGHEEAIFKIIFITKSLLASVGGIYRSSIKIWNFLNGNCLKTILLFSGGVKKILFNSKLEIILTVMGDKIFYFDIRNGQKSYTFKKIHKDFITDFTMSKDQEKIFTIGMDLQLVNWNII